MQSIVLQLRGLSLISCGASRNVQRLNIGQIALLGILLILQGRFLLDGRVVGTLPQNSYNLFPHL